MALVVENDQTDCGQLAPMQRFKASCRVNQLPVTLTFDMGNWLWVGDSPEEAARHLAPPSAISMSKPQSRIMRTFAPSRQTKLRHAGWRCSTTCLPMPRAVSNFRWWATI